jgi:transmembrane sensor
MSNRRKSPWRGCRGCAGGRRIGVLVLLVISFLRVDSGRWVGSHEPQWAVYATNVGAARTVTLQDGSQVDLNTNSEIRVRFTVRQREIVLLHGEALFAPVQRPAWPLSVRAGTATITTSGMKFSVRLHENAAAEVLVVEGGISIDGGRGLAVARTADGRAASPFSLRAFPGELISINPMTVLTRTQLSPATLKRKTAWTDGWIWFAKDPLPEAVAEFNRYHRQRLVLVDPALASLEIGGRFRSADLDSFIATLEHSFNVRAVSSAVRAAGSDSIYLTGRCGRAQQQCNWSLVQ